MPRRKEQQNVQPPPDAARQTTTSSSTSSGLPDNTSLSSASSQTLRKRPLAASVAGSSSASQEESMAEDQSRYAASATEERASTSTPASFTGRNQWIVLAVASGACAAFNGVFAKLTTNDLTSKLSQGIAHTFGLISAESVIEVIVRCAFFGLNLVFNGVMWTLFTKALARGSSTTQVSIMNTSTNFMITALLGLIIFSESLPPLWWLGAAMLVAGNVIIGRKDEDGEEVPKGSGAEDNISVAGAADATGATSANLASYGAVPPAQAGLPIEKDDDDEDVALLGNLDDAHELH